MMGLPLSFQGSWYGHISLNDHLVGYEETNVDNSRAEALTPERRAMSWIRVKAVQNQEQEQDRKIRPLYFLLYLLCHKT